jgi:hypothetical protein
MNPGVSKKKVINLIFAVYLAWDAFQLAAVTLPFLVTALNKINPEQAYCFKNSHKALVNGAFSIVQLGRYLI